MDLLGKLKKWLRLWVYNVKAELSANDVIVLGVAFFMLAVVFPIGMTQVTSANTTGWNAAVTTIFTVLCPILAIIGAAVRFLPRLRGGG